jgi:hypothetical protein
MPRSRALATLTKNDSISLSPEPCLNLGRFGSVPRKPKPDALNPLPSHPRAGRLDHSIAKNRPPGMKLGHGPVAAQLLSELKGAE